MKKLLLVVCIIAVTTASCKKNKTDSSDICTTAKVYYGGDPNTDGLGWILLTDSVAFKYKAPENLDPAFQVQGLIVDFCYYETDRDFVCLCPPPLEKWVHITSIKIH